MNRLTSCKVLTEKKAEKKYAKLASCLFAAMKNALHAGAPMSVSAGKERVLARKELSVVASSQYSRQSVEATVVTEACDVQNGRQSSFFGRIRRPAREMV